MGKFKDRLDKLGELCEPGGTIVNYKSKLPEGQPPPVMPPEPGAPGTGAGEICNCVDTKLDEVIDEVRNTYPYGPPFNTGKLFISVSTPIPIDESITKPSTDPSVIGFYDETLVAPKRSNLNARQIWVIADPDKGFDPNDPFLYVRISNDGKAFSVEIPVRCGEDWGFRDVYSFRIRSPFAGQQYRITTDPHRTTFVSVPITNVPPTPIINQTANRTDFIDINVPVGLVDSILPSIVIPNGFSVSIRSSVDNQIGSRIFTSRTDATVPGNRNTLLPGDVKEYFITNTDLIHVAGDQLGLSIDISVEL